MENGRFITSGWTPPVVAPAGGWASIFKVYAGPGGDVPAMLGSYSVEHGSIVFRPRFPLSPGIVVRAVLSPPGGPSIERSFELPRVMTAPSTRVQQVYPSADVLPENQLKLYVEFSAPMQRGQAWKRILLLDEKGSAIDLPFLEIEQELWDREGKRLTILFDPGRIKRGLASLDEAGPVLEEGRAYTLVIDREWRDAHGVPLKQEFRKKFRAGASDRTPLDPAGWQIVTPAVNTSELLIVRFPEPLDYALLHRLLHIENVRGSISAGSLEREWRFVPRDPWQAGEYRLVVDTSLEDLAGNRVGRAFDVDTFERVTRHVERETVSLPFRLGLK
jgi:hypothetical protein